MTDEILNNRELWIMGVDSNRNRAEQLRSYLTACGYANRHESFESFAENHPLGVVLDISPFSDDGWGVLLKIKNDPLTRDIPVLPVFIDETGNVGGVFPVAGFFTLPIDENHLLERLAVYGLTEDAETWNLQALVVSRSGEEQLSKTIELVGFEVVKAYTGKESLALTSIRPYYMVFSSLILPDMTVFELLEKFHIYPYSGNTPIFVLLKNEMKEGEKRAMSRAVANLVDKKQLTCEEFKVYLRRRG